MKMIKLMRYLLMILAVISCRSESQKIQEARHPEPAGNLPAGETRINEPVQNQKFVSGEIIPVWVEVTDSSVPVDSVILYAGGKLQEVAAQPPYRFDCHTGPFPVGKTDIRTTTIYRNGARESNQVSVVLLSDIEPEELAYTVTNIYAHDIQAYTQGLVFHDGYLYEGTGQWNESSLRKVEIETGTPERVLNLSGDIFGEGITIFGDKIYQLTYKSQVGFVYDLHSFERLQKVYYQNHEGWGLTHDSTHLIMSEGSHILYYMDPEYFTETRRIEVYDHNGRMDSLNELEYINGRIFANIYGSERIVVIDPASGKVIATMDMSGLLPDARRHRKIDVFNGIAWNPGRELMYVTGKYWPSLFEIKLTDF